MNKEQLIEAVKTVNANIKKNGYSPNEYSLQVSNRDFLLRKLVEMGALTEITRMGL